MMAVQGIGVLFAIIYLLGIVLVVWALVLLIIFLRLRIAELRRRQAGELNVGRAGSGGTPGP